MVRELLGLTMWARNCHLAGYLALAAEIQHFLHVSGKDMIANYIGRVVGGIAILGRMLAGALWSLCYRPQDGDGARGYHYEQ